MTYDVTIDCPFCKAQHETIGHMDPTGQGHEFDTDLCQECGANLYDELNEELEMIIRYI